MVVHRRKRQQGPTHATSIVDEVLTCGSIDLESWNFPSNLNEDSETLTAAERDSGIRRLVSEPLGVVATESLYVPEYAPFAATHYKALAQNCLFVDEDTGMLSHPMDSFPGDGETGTEKLARWHDDPSEFGCTSEDRNALGWSEAKCQVGRWYAGLKGYKVVVLESTWRAAKRCTFFHLDSYLTII